MFSLEAKQELLVQILAAPRCPLTLCLTPRLHSDPRRSPCHMTARCSNIRQGRWTVAAREGQSRCRHGDGKVASVSVDACDLPRRSSLLQRSWTCIAEKREETGEEEAEWEVRERKDSLFRFAEHVFLFFAFN